jgi:hypothetical protein
MDLTRKIVVPSLVIDRFVFAASSLLTGRHGFPYQQTENENGGMAEWTDDDLAVAIKSSLLEYRESIPEQLLLQAVWEFAYIGRPVVSVYNENGLFDTVATSVIQALVPLVKEDILTNGAYETDGEAIYPRERATT